MLLSFKSEAWAIVPQVYSDNLETEEIKPSDYVENEKQDSEEYCDSEGLNMDVESFEDKYCYVNRVRQVIELKKSYLGGSKIVICCLEAFGVNLFINTGSKMYYLASKYWEMDMINTIEVHQKTNEIYILTRVASSYVNMSFLRKIQISFL